MARAAFAARRLLLRLPLRAGLGNPVRKVVADAGGKAAAVLLEDGRARVLTRVPEAHETFIAAPRRKSCQAMLSTLQQALDQYEVDKARHPEPGNANLVKALIRPTPPDPAYFVVPDDRINEKGELLDPWGNAYVYEFEEGRFVLYSRGPDGVDEKGKGDDLALPR
jgi:hypothetical protein